MNSNDQGNGESKPLIPYARLEDMPTSIQAPIKDYIQRMGFLPNALKLYMHRPELLQCLIQMNDTTMRHESSHLDAELKRKVSVLCSALNHSAYCVAHTAGIMKKHDDSDDEGWGYSEQDIAKFLNDEDDGVDAAEAACLAYARAATLDASDVPQDIVVTLSELLTPPQVVELACVVGFWKMYNTIHESLYVPLESELMGDSELSSDELLSEKAVVGEAAEVNATVEIYATATCPFCRRAKRLLTARGAAYIEHDVSQDQQRFDEMLQRANGRRTVPQILVNGELVGGLDQLLALDRVGELMPMLNKNDSD